MEIVVLGKKGGETKIILDNGRDFQKSFLKLSYVKSSLGESFEQIQEKRNQEILKEKKKLADMEKQAPNDKEFIEALKDEIEKKEREKKAKEKKFYETKQLEVMNEREKEVKQKN